MTISARCLNFAPLDVPLSAMAKKASKKKASTRTPRPGNTRYRRTDDELIEDLKRKIEEVKARAAARALKETSKAVREAIKCTRNLTKAIEMAQAEGNTKLHHALVDSHQALTNFFAAEGIQMPKVRRPRGRRPKVGEE